MFKQRRQGKAAFMLPTLPDWSWDEAVSLGEGEENVHYRMSNVG